MLFSIFLNYWLILDLLIPVITGQIFNPITELTIPMGIPAKEEKQKLKHNLW